MSIQTIKIFGSDSDLKDLREVLSKAGVEEVQSNIIHATDPSAGAVLPLFALIVVRSIPEISKCIQVHLKERGKRMVTTVTPDGIKRTMRGNFTAKEFAENMETSAGFRIEDDKNDT